MTFEIERSSDCVNVCDAVAPRRRVSKVYLLLLGTLRPKLGFSYGGARTGGGGRYAGRDRDRACRYDTTLVTTILGSDYNH